MGAICRGDETKSATQKTEFKGRQMTASVSWRYIGFACALVCMWLSGAGMSQSWAAKDTKADKRDTPDKRDAQANDDAKPAARPAAAAAPAPPSRRPPPPASKQMTSEQLYTHLLGLSKQKSLISQATFGNLHKASHRVDWSKGKKESFSGHLRFLKYGNGGKADGAGGLYLLRKEDGGLMILSLPKQVKDSAKSPYTDLQKALRNKMNFSAQVAPAVVGGVSYSFAKLLTKPKRGTIDRLFFIAIVALLFFVMLGMGLTLTMQDFALILKKPKGMIVGPLCQFGLLPLLAFGIGHLFGFVQSAPFIFLGLLLVSCSPGGVTSNLMTYFAKGDVALSVSLTALSTVLSIFFTPLLLGLYASNIPQLKVPVGAIVVQILVLVIVPLGIGLIVRARMPNFAQKSEKFFSALGMFSLLFLIVVGVLGNLSQFADTARYSPKFYASIFLLTFFGMFFGALISKLLGVSNYQTRAIALETGLQNASLAMTFALLLQDQMGDFYSSMFFTSGIFGLWMYFAGGVMILLFRAWLPISLEESAEAATTPLHP